MICRFEIGDSDFWVSIRHASSCLRHGRRIQLKALWGGHTAALQFMLGRQLQMGERKHAIQSRRLQDEKIILAGYPRAAVCCFFQVSAAEHQDGDMSTTYLASRLSLTYLCDVNPRAVSIFEQNDDESIAKIGKCHPKCMRWNT